MILFIYSMYDKKAEAYGRPFYAHSNGCALRMVMDGMRKNGDDLVTKYPDDFVLYQLGKFNDSDGKIESGVYKVSECSCLMEKKDE